MRVERIGECELWLGDMRTIVPTLGAVDHCISDPPYEQRSQDAIGGIKRNDGGKVTERLSFAGIDEIRGQTCNLIGSITKEWVVLFCTAEGVAPWRDALEASKIKYKRACAWIKPDAMPQFNGQGPASGLEMFVAAWAGRGKSTWNAKGKRGVYTHCTNQPDREGRHPTEKPLPLMSEILGDFTATNNIVLDPFMGSGTTGVACAKLGRRFIGVEIDEGYFNIACRRIEEAYRQPDFFVERPAPAEQLSLLGAAE